MFWEQNFLFYTDQSFSLPFFDQSAIKNTIKYHSLKKKKSYISDNIWEEEILFQMFFFLQKVIATDKDDK